MDNYIKRPRVDTILFDFDGTIMDTNDVVYASWIYTIELFGLTPPPEAVLRATFGEPLEYTMSRILPGVDRDEAIKHYREYQAAHYDEAVRMFPGVPEAIAELHGRGVKLGVVTNRLRPTTLSGLAKFGMDRYMQCVITFGDTLRAKPYPDPVLLAIEKLDSEAEKTVFVGDTLFDLECARAAGVTAAIVAWSEAGSGVRELADVIIGTAEDLLRLV